METLITVNVFDKDNGKFLHCFSGTSSKVEVGETISFNYTINDVDIDNAEFNVTWVSDVVNGQQTVSVEYIKNTGNILFPQEIKEQLKIVSHIFHEIDKRLVLMGDKMQRSTLEKAYVIIRKYLQE